MPDRRLQRWLAGTSTSAASSHGAADLLGLNRAHICVRNQFTSLAHAQIVIEAWRREYNEDRPKKGLGGLTPAH